MLKLINLVTDKTYTPLSMQTGSPILRWLVDPLALELTYSEANDIAKQEFWSDTPFLLIDGRSGTNLEMFVSLISIQNNVNRLTSWVHLRELSSNLNVVEQLVNVKQLLETRRLLHGK